MNNSWWEGEKVWKGEGREGKGREGKGREGSMLDVDDDVEELFLQLFLHQITLPWLRGIKSPYLGSGASNHLTLAQGQLGTSKKPLHVGEESWPL